MDKTVQMIQNSCLAHVRYYGQKIIIYMYP